MTLIQIPRRRGEHGNRMDGSKRVWLIGIVGVGIFLRFFRVSHQSLWLDEAFSALLAQRDWGQIVSGTAQDTMPPLYYLVLHAFLALGKGEFFVRLPSVLWGILTIPLLYALGRRLFNEKVGLVSAGLLAVNPFHVFYSQEARMYSQLGFLGLLSAFCFLRAWQGGKWQDWLGFVLSTAAALYTQNMAFLLLVAFGAFALFQWQKTKQKVSALVIALASIGLLFLPWLLYLPDQVARVGGKFWVQTPSILELFTALGLFLFGYALSTPLVIAALIVGLYATFLTFLIGWQVYRREEEREPLLFVFCLFAVPLASSFLISLLWPIFLPRTLIVSALALIILLAWGLTQAPRALVSLLIAPGLVLMGLSLYNSYANPIFAKPPMRAAASYLQDHIQGGDTVIHTSDSSYLTFAYYAPELERHFLVGDPDYEDETTRGRTGRIAGIKPESLEKTVNARERLWLIIVLDHNIEHQQKIYDDIDLRYPLLNKTNIGGGNILLYDLKLGGGASR